MQSEKEISCHWRIESHSLFSSTDWHNKKALWPKRTDLGSRCLVYGLNLDTYDDYSEMFSFVFKNTFQNI